ncbi:MAG: ThiF family adenylyltransferase [Halobacteriaceae archaeon]
MTEGALDAGQVERYARHLVLEDVGPEGQAALLDASVLVVGAGGLGCPAIQYLATAGVGRLGVVDDDVVERSNLQRQTLFREDDVGASKAERAAAFVAARNPDVAVDVHDRHLGPAEADLVAEYDVVLDCTDDVPTRFLLNDACRLAGVPLVHAAVDRFHGQVTTFAPDGPCYRCLFPEAPPADAVTDCATAGVLGALPGTLGTVQATEALRTVLGVGDSLAGRLLVYDARGLTAEEVPLRADPDCPLCGTDPAIDAVAAVTYEGDCSV